MDSKVRQEVIILISVFARIGLSALMAMLMEIEYQAFRILRSCVIVESSLTQYSLIQHLLHPLDSDVATWQLVLVNKFPRGQA